MNYHYSMNIEWSEEDQLFVVSLPEFGPYASTHGSTYKEAVRRGQEALESLIDAFQAEGRMLPKPNKYRPRKTTRTVKKKESLEV